MFFIIIFVFHLKYKNNRTKSSINTDVAISIFPTYCSLKNTINFFFFMRFFYFLNSFLISILKYFSKIQCDVKNTPKVINGAENTSIV